MKIRTKIIAILLLSLFLSCSSDDDGDQQLEYKLEQIQGKWLRVGGNHPANNGMIMNVENDQGYIVEPAESGFDVGEVKWKDIVAQDETHYRYGELGSDSGYYSSSIRFGIDDTLRISVDAQPGSGYVQKWVRKK